MTNQDIIGRLNDLIQLDVDASEAYNQALKKSMTQKYFKPSANFATITYVTLEN